MKKKRKPKTPAKIITQCPCCKSTDLIFLEIDVLCSRCDWSSVEGFVNAGGMDNIVAAYNEHFMKPTHSRHIDTNADADQSTKTRHIQSA